MITPNTTHIYGRTAILHKWGKLMKKFHFCSFSRGMVIAILWFVLYPQVTALYCSVVVKVQLLFYQIPSRPRAELTARKKSSCAAISLLLNICSAEAIVTTGFSVLSSSQLVLPTEYCSVIEHCNLQWIFLHKNTLFCVAQYNKFVL